MIKKLIRRLFFHSAKDKLEEKQFVDSIQWMNIICDMRTRLSKLEDRFKEIDELDRSWKK